MSTIITFKDMDALRSVWRSVVGGGAGSDVPTPAAKISELWVYPVKGMAGYRLTEAAGFDGRGLLHDRQWLVVREEEENRFLSQRQAPKLATLQARVEEAADGSPAVLHLSTTEHTLVGGAVEELAVPVRRASDADAATRVVKVWGDTIPSAVDQGDAAAAWLQRVLAYDEKLRLVYCDPAVTVRAVSDKCVPADEAGTHFTGFADGFPMLLTSDLSLDDLNARIAANSPGTGPLPMTRFRPNIVVQAVGSPSPAAAAGGAAAGGAGAGSASEATVAAALQPWAEQRWRAFDIIRPAAAAGSGTASLVVAKAQGVKKCARCLVPTTDQVTGVQGGRKAEPLVTLSTFNADSAGDVYFGIVSVRAFLQAGCCGALLPLLAHAQRLLQQVAASYCAFMLQVAAR